MWGTKLDVWVHGSIWLETRHRCTRKPKLLGSQSLVGLIGPGIVMCGIQIGDGRWLFGPAFPAKYVMGNHVGAIASVVGGWSIKLSHSLLCPIRCITLACRTSRASD